MEPYDGDDDCIDVASDDAVSDSDEDEHNEGKDGNDDESCEFPCMSMLMASR
jgi:hypothetical protein